MSKDCAAALDAAGVRRVLFIRHANAAPPGGKKKSEYNGIHDWQRDDQLRPLTEKGKQQAEVARNAWFLPDVTLQSHKCLCSSGARRAAETLQLLGAAEAEVKKTSILASFLGCSSASAVSVAQMEAQSQLVPSLHPAGISPKCEELFDKNGYAPLRKFYSMEGGEGAFADYGEIVCKEIAALCPQVAGQSGDTISFFGHAVFLNAVAMQLATAWGQSEETRQKLIDMDLGEAEGIMLERDGSSVQITHKTVRPHELW